MNFFSKLLNSLVIKHKNRYYFLPHDNCLKDKYDLLNPTGDNVLSLLSFIIKNKKDANFEVYLEINDPKKIPDYERFNDGVLKIKYFISPRSGKCKHPLIQKIKNIIARFSCSIWACSSPFAFNNIKTKKQKIICLSYCTPFKTDIVNGNAVDLSYLDCRIETSLLTASIHSAELRNKIINSKILGFPRNDNLINNSNSSNVIDWIKSKTNKKNGKILVYAPTYRDYEGAYENTNVLGFKESNEQLSKFLEENNFILVVKHHPLQKVDTSGCTDRIIFYEQTEKFSLYDLLYVSDMLISDYSSVVHDYLLTNKPVILDDFDIERYEDSRGFSFEPIDYICPCEICHTYDEVKKSIVSQLNSEKRSEKYFNVQKMFHKYVDANSSSRVFDFLNNLCRKDKK